MDIDGNKWFSGLRDYAKECRRKGPLPDRGTLTTEQEMRCRITGGSVLSWLRQHGPRFLQERQVLHKTMDVSPDPWIVFTSNLPGLIAASEIVGVDSERIVFLSEGEFKQWLADSPDERYKWHVHFWSLFLDKLQPDFLERATRQHPIPPACAYWQHAEGTMWGELAGCGGDHLWKWDGKEPALLEEALTNWVS